jgi:hypothetical protein
MNIHDWKSDSHKINKKVYDYEAFLCGHQTLEKLARNNIYVMSTYFPFNGSKKHSMTST